MLEFICYFQQNLNSLTKGSRCVERVSQLDFIAEAVMNILKPEDFSSQDIDQLVDSLQTSL